MAQQPIGRIAMENGAQGKTADAQAVKVTGAVTVDGKKLLLGNGSDVAAGDDPVKIALTQGGNIRLCSLSGLHLSAGGAGATQALMLALDKGAVEVQMSAATSNDVLLTPDLRFTLNHPGMEGSPLDLRVRVTKSGDTCVENRGEHAPVLSLTEQFGAASYQILPGQHVLFEHGSLSEVVDNEPSPCGCPPLLGDTMVAGKGKAGSKEAEHPFPLAVSEGLARPPAPAPSKPGETEMQVTMPMVYSGDAPAGTDAAPATGAAASSAESAPVPVAQTRPKRGFFGSVGHFFKRVFGGK